MMYSVIANRLATWFRNKINRNCCNNLLITDRAAPCAALGGSSDSACRHSECPVELACASLGCASSCIMNALQSTADAHVGQDAVQEHRSLVEMVIGLLPNRLVFPPVIERQYRDARAK